MFILYDLLYLLFCFAYVPYLVIKQKWHPHFFMRMGFLPENLLQRLQQQQNIWVHAVSVGEVLAVKGVIKQIRRKFPRYRMVISTVTQTGYVIAQSNFSPSETVIYAPLDFSFIARKFINMIKPKLYITAETEIWPNLLTLLSAAHIPVAQINGRISDKSFGGYRRVGFLTRRVLKAMSVFCMQTQSDAQRIITLGASQDNVQVVGNLKFDDAPLADEFRFEKLGFQDNERVWIAGSTHGGEEDIVLDVYKKLQPEFKDLRLILAPRHPERTAEILRLVEQRGFTAIKFSELRKGKSLDQGIIVVDTMGHLKALYPLAHLVFVGKSLTVGGGHNIIEPAGLAKPIVFGPRMDNFKDIVRIFMERKAVIQVEDETDLLVRVRELLKSPEKMNQLGQRAKEVVLGNRGAVEKTIDILSKFLKE